MLYDVPQTDDPSEAAMAALVARLRASAPKPEAIPAGAAVDAQLAIILARWVDSIGSALGDRATLPLLRWDGALDGVCIALAARQWFDTRGRDRKAGADSGIDRNADDAAATLARLRPGGDGSGKTENPRYVDSGANVPQDAPGIKSSGEADSWIGRRAGRSTR